MYSTALLDMSYTYELMGALDKANDIYQRVLKTNKAILKQSPNRYLQTLFDMANRLASRGTKKYEEENKVIKQRRPKLGSSFGIDGRYSPKFASLCNFRRRNERFAGVFKCWE